MSIKLLIVILIMILVFNFLKIIKENIENDLNVYYIFLSYYFITEYFEYINVPSYKALDGSLIIVHS